MSCSGLCADRMACGQFGHGGCIWGCDGAAIHRPTRPTRNRSSKLPNNGKRLSRRHGRFYASPQSQASGREAKNTLSVRSERHTKRVWAADVLVCPSFGRVDKREATNTLYVCAGYYNSRQATVVHSLELVALRLGSFGSLSVPFLSRAS